ncbi:hypothetical protein ACO1O0_001485 [Amphichorda felina]
MDLMAVHASREIASKWSAKLGKMTLRIDELEYGHLSLLGIELGPRIMAAVEQPSSLSPIPYTATPHVIPGVHRDPVLGLLSNSSPSANQVRALVNRTWGLLGGPDGSWGPSFQYNEYDMAPSFFGGIVNMLRCWLITSLLGLARFGFFKNLLLHLAPNTGSGPTDEQVRSVPVKMQALVAADPAEEGQHGKYCHIKLAFPDGHYPFAGLIMAQAAATLLYGRNLSAGIRGGCLTPGVLGHGFVDRVRSGGLELESTLLENAE